MKACPQCATVATGPSVKCRACGALLVAPPSAPTPQRPDDRAPALVGARAHTTAATAEAHGDAPAPPPADDRFFAPARFVPVPVAPPAERRPARRVGPLAAVVIVVVVCACAGAAYAAVRALASGSGASAPVALPPVAESEGMPGLADAFRVQAEASRQRAFVVAAQATAEAPGVLDAASLQRLDPSLTWVGADASSTGPTVVSFAQAGDSIVVAVANTAGNVCAYGRLPLAGIGEYVTLGNVETCRAADAPSSGWTQLSPVGGMQREPSPEMGY
jgi:hypothetical protein